MLARRKCADGGVLSVGTLTKRRERINNTAVQAINAKGTITPENLSGRVES
jgi:hypothetical protein